MRLKVFMNVELGNFHEETFIAVSKNETIRNFQFPSSGAMTL